MMIGTVTKTVTEEPGEKVMACSSSRVGKESLKLRRFSLTDDYLLEYIDRSPKEVSNGCKLKLVYQHNSEFGSGGSERAEFAQSKVIIVW